MEVTLKLSHSAFQPTSGCNVMNMQMPLQSSTIGWKNTSPGWILGLSAGIIMYLKIASRPCLGVRGQEGSGQSRGRIPRIQ